MLVGALLFSAVGIGAAVGGSWVPLGVVLAAGFTALTVWRQPRRIRFADVVVLTALLVVLARTFTAYVTPYSGWIGSVVVIVVAAAVAVFGGDVGPWTARVLGGLLVVGAAVFVLVSVGVAPVPGIRFDGSPGGGVVAGLLLVAVFTVTDSDAPRRVLLPRLGVAAVASVAVSWAALHQLGSVRLGLSPAPLHDALAAADASTLDTALTVVVAVSVVLALVVVLGRIHGTRVHNGRPWWTTLGAGILAAAVSPFVPTVWALAVASAVTIAAAIAGWIPAKMPA